MYDLKEIGYQAGTGAMIGMPFQTAEDMADDLLFYKQFDAPMVGMGPYNPHPETPEEQMVKYNLYDRKTSLPDGPMSVDEMDGRSIVIGYGR